MRPTALGATAVERARRILAEIEAAERAIDAARSGRTGVFRVTATPPWIETVLARAAARFRETFPAVELRMRSATRAEGLRRLADGDCDLHCGGVDTDEPLPAFLRRERFLDMTAGIVACRDHPLFAGTVVPQDLARYPWIDFDWPAPASLDENPQPGQMHRTPHIQGILATLQTTTRPARTSRIGVFPGWGLKPVRLPVNCQCTTTLLLARKSRSRKDSSHGET